MGVLTARVGEGTSVSTDGSKFLETVLHWRMSTERHDIEDLMEVRIALEGVSSGAAACKSDENDLEALQELVTKMEKSVDNPKRFAELDLQFHLAMARASKNKLLFDLITLIRGQLERGVARVLQTPHAIPLSVKEHRAVLEAIIQRKPKRARAAMNAHLNAAVQRYHGSLHQ